MKKTFCASGHRLAVTIAAIAVSALPCAALTPPALRIADTKGNSVTIDQTGVVTSLTTGSVQTTACSNLVGGVITTLALVSANGTITWCGTVGGFTITNAIALPPLTGEAIPGLDLGLGTVTSSTGGTLTASFTVTSLGQVTGPVALATITANGATTYQAYIDPADQPFGENGTPVVSQTGVTTNDNTSASPVIPNTPVSMTIVSTITVPANGVQYSDDAGFNATQIVTTILSPAISLSKTANVTSIQPFQKVTYTYVVSNTGTAALSNLVVTDDNGTPNYPGDDFTVCTIASLAVGASQTCTATVYPPVSQGANDTGPSGTFNYQNYHPGGTLICEAQSNGDMVFTFLADESVIDNTYGSGSAPSWPQGNSSWNYLGNSSAEFQIFDGKGNKCLDFTAAYASPNWSLPSGWGPGNPYNVIGNAGYIASIDTTLSDNLNKNKATATCLSNSPATPGWIDQSGYTVHVKSGAWGSNGFGSIQCPSLSNGYTKNGNCTQHLCKPVNSNVTNTATVTGTYGSIRVSAMDTATVAIVANPAPPKTPVPVAPTCNVYSKTAHDCQPQNGGHDGNGYSYCDDLLGNQVTCNGVTYVVGSASGPCSQAKGTVPVPAGNYSCAKILGAGVNGNQTNQCFTINYTDGTSSKVYQSLSDWCYPANFAGETIAKNMPYRTTPGGGKDYTSNNVYAYSLPCDNTKAVKSITLPNNRNVVVTSVTMTP